MEILRTPEERFAGLQGFPFEARFVQAGGFRIHYVDEGPREGPPILLLHGEPTWSYLYRKMIPILAAAGLRAVAPDLVGFGRSDKLSRRGDYSYQLHVDTVRSFVETTGLAGITLFGQDWGGLIGLRIAAEDPDRFARIVAANTMLPTGDHPPTEAFLKWREFSQSVAEFHAGGIVKGGCAVKPSPEVVAAYNAPFPDESFKAGARVFPMLVPASPGDPAAPANRRAWEVLRRWDKPFLTLFSDGDPVTRGGDLYFQKHVPGARGQPHATIRGAGHFLQEDKGEELAAAVVDFVGRTAAAR